MAESVLRVQRRAGDFAQRVKGLREDVRSLSEQLESVDPRLADSVRRIDEYRQRIRGGEFPTRDDQKEASRAYRAATRYVRQNVAQVGDQGLVERVQSFMQTAAVGATGRPAAPAPTAPEPTAPAPTQPRPAAPPAPGDAQRPGARPDTPAPPAPGAAGAITPEERERLRGRGVSDSEIGRAKWLRRPTGPDDPGTLLIEPPRPPSRPAPEPDTEPEAPGASPAAPAPQPAPANNGATPSGPPPAAPRPGGPAPAAPGTTPAVRRDADEVEDAMTREERATRRNAEAKRVNALSDRQLRSEFTQTQRELRGHEREMDQLYRQEERLQTARSRGRASDIEERRQYLRDRFSTLQEENRSARERDTTLRGEIAQRGGRVAGDYVEGLGAAGGRTPMASFMAGLGLGGGGGVGGALLGGAMGTLGWGAALPLAAGYAISSVIRRGSQAYDSYEGRLQATERVGRVVQRSGRSVIDEVDRHGRMSRLFGVDDLIGAERTMVHETGLRRLPTDVLRTAAATGRSAEEQAAVSAQMMRLGRGIDPRVSSRILAEFVAAGTARRQQPTVPVPVSEAERRNNAGRRVALAAGVPATDVMPEIHGRQFRERQAGPEQPPRRAGLPFDTSLAPLFEQQTIGVANAQASPFVRAPLEGVAAQVREAAQLDFPGIDSRSPGGNITPQQIEAGGAFAQQFNATLTAPTGGPLDDARVLAIMRLRKNKQLVERLKKMDLDITTIPGAMRAIRRAPQLAQQGIPEVAESIYGTQRELFSSPDFLEMAYGSVPGADPEAAHVMATRDMRGMLRPGRAAPLDMAAISAGVTSSPEVQNVFEKFMRPDFDELKLGGAIGEKLGPVVTKALNDLSAGLNTVVSEMLNAAVNAPPEVGP